MSGSEQIWMNLNESDWDWVGLYASDARHQARQAKPHPSHQSPIQLWLGLSVYFLDEYLPSCYIFNCFEGFGTVAKPFSRTWGFLVLGFWDLEGASLFASVSRDQVGC